MSRPNCLQPNFESIETQLLTLTPCHWHAMQMVFKSRSEKSLSPNWVGSTITFRPAKLLSLNKNDRRKMARRVIDGLKRLRPNDFFDNHFLGEDFLNHELKHIEALIGLRPNINLDRIFIDTTLVKERDQYGLATITDVEEIAPPLTDEEDFIVGLAPRCPSSGDIFKALGCLLRMKSRGELTSILLRGAMEMCNDKITVKNGKIEQFDFIEEIGKYLL